MVNLALGDQEGSIVDARNCGVVACNTSEGFICNVRRFKVVDALRLPPHLARTLLGAFEPPIGSRLTLALQIAAAAAIYGMLARTRAFTA